MFKKILEKAKKIIIGALIGVSIFSASAFGNITYASPMNGDGHTVEYKIQRNKSLIKQKIECEIGESANLESKEYELDMLENTKLNLLNEINETLKRNEQILKQQSEMENKIKQKEQKDFNIDSQEASNIDSQLEALEKTKHADDLRDNQKQRMKDKSIESMQQANPVPKQKFIGGVVGDLLEGEDTDENSVEVQMNKKSGWLGARLYKGLTNAINTLFDFIYQTVIKTPKELIQNEVVSKLYMIIVILATMLMAIFMVYGQLTSIIAGENGMSIINMFTSVLKNVTYMFGFSYIFPKIIYAINLLAEQILSLGQNQIQINAVLSIMESGGVVSAGNYLLSFLMIILMMVLFVIIFLKACSRYWDITKLFITAPLAFASNSSPETCKAFYTWKDSIKYVLLSQISYAIHLTIFGAIMIAPMPEGFKMMLLIGGMIGLFKLSSNVRSIFQKSEEQSVRGFTGTIRRFMRVI